MAPTFADCRLALERYAERLRAVKMSDRANHLLQEVRARLRQLDWLYSRLMEIEASIDRSARSSSPDGRATNARIKHVFTEASAHTSDSAVQANLSFQPSDELRLLLEAFYYSAHRVRDILRDHKTDLPGLSAFEAVGVRDVRNHLVEHPSRAKGVLVPSVACGGPVGPQLRLLRWSLDSSGMHDRGLPANAQEFLVALHRVLQSTESNAV
jgi:hypothetical protein